jgi:hypothetical protein
MSATVDASHNARFKTGGIILLVAAALMTLNYAVLMLEIATPLRNLQCKIWMEEQNAC